uniref:THAP domain-containing protein 5 n=1 Tax=Oreochromis aureus TaxID=47969 RepID=A0A668UBY4_OREAU
MPRYCAVRVCRNRGGTASRQDNKRISFYPFPLQDKSRLQKWVSNMKREQWTPSRHQYLCSEHFTADCFDIRWGIRYLKNTAIPTIFPSSEDVCILQHLVNIKLRIQF